MMDSLVFITYIELLNSTQDRQQELMQTYYFLCECTRCKDIEEIKLNNSMACPNKKCPAGIAVQSKENLDENEHLLTSCPACNENIKTDLFIQYQEAHDYVNLQLQNMKNFVYLDVCKICLEKQNGLFHPLNLQRVKVLDSAFESSVILNQWRTAKHYGKQLLPGYKRYYGEFHPLTGILQLKLAKIYLYLEKAWEAVPMVHAAECILRVTHGCDHPLYKDQLVPLLAQIQ